MKKFFTEKNFNLLHIILIITLGELFSQGIDYVKTTLDVGQQQVNVTKTE